MTREVETRMTIHKEHQGLQEAVRSQREARRGLSREPPEGTKVLTPGSQTSASRARREASAVALGHPAGGRPWGQPEEPHIVTRLVRAAPGSPRGPGS